MGLLLGSGFKCIMASVIIHRGRPPLLTSVNERDKSKAEQLRKGQNIFENELYEISRKDNIEYGGYSYHFLLGCDLARYRIVEYAMRTKNTMSATRTNLILMQWSP